jgi:hypothetical protein
MKELISQFYEGIRSTGKPPIPYREITLTAWMMDEIFREIAPALEERENPLAHAVP